VARIEQLRRGWRGGAGIDTLGGVAVQANGKLVVAGDGGASA
jgi:hypothetical protein